MRKLAYIAIIALASTLALSACGHKNHPQQHSQANAGPTKPTDKTDTQAWDAYLGSVLNKHLQGIKITGSTYPYMIPAGDSDKAKASRQRQQDNISTTVQRGVTPGNLLAFAGADSTTTANVVVSAFKNAQPGSMKGVIVMFIGDKADEQRVGAVVKPTGAKYRFVAM